MWIRRFKFINWLCNQLISFVGWSLLLVVVNLVLIMKNIQKHAFNERNLSKLNFQFWGQNNNWNYLLNCVFVIFASVIFRVIWISYQKSRLFILNHIWNEIMYRLNKIWRIDWVKNSMCIFFVPLSTRFLMDSFHGIKNIMRFEMCIG